MAGGFDAGGDWSIRFPKHEGVKCYAVVSGECWLALDGESAGASDAVRLQAGDCFLLPRGLPFRMASDLALTPVDVQAHPAEPLRGGVRTFNGGGSFFGVGALFTFAGQHADILLGALPPIVHLQKESDKAALRWALERLGQELREPQPGGFLIAQQLAYLVLIQALRLHLEGASGGVGWLFALADSQMRTAIQAMHEAPAHRWSLQELAAQAGMSRSSFALKFKQTVGSSPLEYLTRWRMLLAGDRLVSSDDPISAIAPSLGYESESAFSTAFKRVMGCSPRHYGRGLSPAN